MTESETRERASKNAQQLLADFHDNERFCRESLSVQNKHGQLIPFIWGPAQRLFFDAVEKQRLLKRPVRIIYLKGRQVWVSTAVAALFWKQIAFQDGQRAQVYAHDDDSAQKIFEYYERFHSHYQPFRGVLGLPRVKSLNLEEGIKYTTGSAIEIRTANNVKGGRSRTSRYLHLSEFALWRDPKTLMGGLMQSLPDDPGTMAVIESTAFGMGNMFHEMWEQASDPEGDSAWVPLFFPWWQHPEYRLEVEDPFRFEVSLGETGHALRTKYNLSLEQLNWRRWAIANKCHHDPREFQQEYPSDPDEAFLVSGRPRFEPKLLVSFNEHDGIAGGLAVVEIERREKIVFRPRERGELIIFRNPDPNRRYTIGADSSGNVDVNEGRGTPDPDFAAAQVFDVDSGEQVAVLHARMHPVVFGRYLADLGIYYGGVYKCAYIVPEANGEGLATIHEMLNRQYPSYMIYERRSDDTRTEERLDRLGFKTTVSSRPRLIARFEGTLYDRSIHLHHRQTIKELKTFVIHPDGKVAAERKCHDDLAIAAMLAVEGMATAPIIDDAPRPYEEDDYPERALSLRERAARAVYGMDAFPQQRILPNRWRNKM